MRTKLTGWLTLIAALCLFACAATVAGRFGFRLGTDETDRYVLAAVCVVAALLCLLMFNVAASFWRSAQYGAALAAGLVWTFAVAVDLTGAVGFSAANRAEAVAAKTKDQLVFDDTRSEVDALEHERARLAGRLDELKGVKPIDAAKADQAKLELARAFAVTKSCTAILTKRQRRHCEAWVAAKAQVALAEEAAAGKASLLALMGKLETARAGSQAVDTSAATSQAQGVVLASILTGSRAPSADAIWWTTVGLCVLLAGMLLCSGLTWDAALRMLGVAAELPTIAPPMEGAGERSETRVEAPQQPARPPLEIVRKVREAYAASAGLYGGVRVQAVA